MIAAPSESLRPNNERASELIGRRLVCLAAGPFVCVAPVDMRFVHTRSRNDSIASASASGRAPEPKRHLIAPSQSGQLICRARKFDSRTNIDTYNETIGFIESESRLAPVVEFRISDSNSNSNLEFAIASLNSNSNCELELRTLQPESAIQIWLVVLFSISNWSIWSIGPKLVAVNYGACQCLFGRFVWPCLVSSVQCLVCSVQCALGRLQSKAGRTRARVAIPNGSCPSPTLWLARRQNKCCQRAPTRPTNTQSDAAGNASRRKCARPALRVAGD